MHPMIKGRYKTGLVNALNVTVSCVSVIK